jgi:hypothetical protein
MKRGERKAVKRKKTNLSCRSWAAFCSLAVVAQAKGEFVD